MKLEHAKFSLGQVINHRLFRYRGAIFEVDPVFRASNEWYEQVAKSRPPKDEPWYHVLVDGAHHTTYVAEQNLLAEPDPKPISHSATADLFAGFLNGRYQPKKHQFQ